MSIMAAATDDYWTSALVCTWVASASHRSNARRRVTTSSRPLGSGRC
jgi:hypothetical protein